MILFYMQTQHHFAHGTQVSVAFRIFGLLEVHLHKWEELHISKKKRREDFNRALQYTIISTQWMDE